VRHHCLLLRLICILHCCRLLTCICCVARLLSRNVERAEHVRTMTCGDATKSSTAKTTQQAMSQTMSRYSQSIRLIGGLSAQHESLSATPVLYSHLHVDFATAPLMLTYSLNQTLSTRLFPLPIHYTSISLLCSIIMRFAESSLKHCRAFCL